jgi:hypothetical protein
VQLVGLTLNRTAIPLIAQRLLAGAVLMSAVAVMFEGWNEQLSARERPNGAMKSAFINESAQSAFDFVNSIGVNTHLNYFDTGYGNFPFVERELKSIGILHLRDGVHLQNADYNSTLYGRWVQLGRSGVRFDAVLDPRSNLGAVNAALLNQVNQLAGQTIESFEGANELDVSNIPNWASTDRSYQEDIYRSARSMEDGQSIRVIGPSMASAFNGAQVGVMINLIDEGNLHPYPAGKMPSVVFPEQADLAQLVSRNKRIVFTETGYHNALNDHSDQPAVSETAAAKYIPRLFLEDYTHSIPRTYLYEFLDEAPDPGLGHFQMHWGLLRADGSEKPAFIAVKNLIEELRDNVRPAQLNQLAWSLSTQSAETHHLLLQKSNGEFDLILWQEVASYDPSREVDIVNAPQTAVLTLGRKARSVTLYEPTAQAEPLQTYGDLSELQLSIPDHPLVVKIVLQ